MKNAIHRYILFSCAIVIPFCVLVVGCAKSADESPGPVHSYHMENVVFENKSAHIHIAGTLTYPNDEGSFPAVILIPGSGRTTRDGSDNEVHRPLYKIADYLTNRGIAVLRCDKRGVGESGGDFDFNTTLTDLASDVRTSLDYLTERPIIDKNRVGFLGHSYGGVVAAQVAAEVPQIAFIVLMASPGLSQGRILSQQISDIPRAFGVHDTTIRKFQIIVDSTEILLSALTAAQRKTAMIEAMYGRRVNQITNDEIATMGYTGYVFQRDTQQYALGMATPFWTEFYTLDPTLLYTQVTCPVLSIIGERDLQVRPKPNQNAITKALKAGKNRHYTIIIAPGMNHLFQPSRTGSPEEYMRTEETMSQSVLNTIYQWIATQLNS